MPRPKKTSTQPKRKIKKLGSKPKPVYPEFIEKFITEGKEKTGLLVEIDQYSKDASYHVGVLQKQGTTHRCIWMVGYATTAQELAIFWTSMAFKSLTKD